MAKIQIKNSFITSSAQITISSSLVRFSGGISAKNITGSFSGSIPQLSSYFKQGGNSFGTTATLGTNDNQALIFETNGSERTRIDTSGNLLVGNSSGTGYRLNVKAPFSSVLGGAYIEVGEYNQKTLVINNTNPSVSSNLFEAQKSGSAVFVLNASGNVGIGTTSPAYTLQVGTGANSATARAAFLGGYTVFENSAGTGNPSITFNNDTDTGILNPAANTIVFTTNGSEKVRIDSTGNIGIGTSSPAYKLDVIGPATSNGVTLRLSDVASLANSRHILLTRGSVSGSIGIAGSQVNDPLWLSRSSGYDLIVASSGNIGIGTTSPTQRLDLSGSLRIRSAGTYSDPTDNAGFINYDSTGGIFTLSARSNGGNTYMAFRTSNAGTAGERMRIINDGNVGIGTTSPAVNLHVVSSGTTIIKTKGGTDNNEGSAFYVEQAGSTNTLTAYGDASAITGGTPDQNVSIWTAGSIPLLFYIGGGERMRITSAGNVGIGTTAPGAKLDVNGDVYVSPNTAGKNTFIFSTNASNDARLLMRSDVTTKVDIQANGTSYFNGGNVGIGTTNPGAKLDVVENTTAVATLRLKNISSTGYSGIEFLDPSNNVDLYIGLEANGGGSRYNSLEGGHRFYISSTEKVRINTDGNVGIGTTSPAYKLDVAGSVYSSNYYSVLTAASYGPSDASATMQVFGSVGSAGLTNTIKFVTGGSERVRITSGGYIGIGTATTTSGLQIQTEGTNTTSGSFLFVNSIGASFGGGAIGVGYQYAAAVGNNFYPFRIRAGSTNAIFTINSTGVVYAGDTTGAVIYGNHDPYYSFNQDTNTGMDWAAADTIAFKTGGAERVRITSVGNVGIGTSSPVAKLEVNGSLYATRLSGSAMFTTNGKGRFYGTASYALASAGGGGSSLTGQTDSASPFETSLGHQAGNSNTGVANTAVGYQALFSNTVGSGSVAFGHQALRSNTTGNFNVAVGALALNKNIVGIRNTAVGHESLYKNNTDGNSAFGYVSLYSNTSGIQNSAFGAFSLTANITGGGNTAFGYSALSSNFGSYNTAIGPSTLTSNTTGIHNVAIGTNAMIYNTTGSNNTTVGSFALYNSAGSGNSSFGYKSLLYNITGVNNCAFGSGSLYRNTSGTKNTAVGSNAGSTITTGTNLSLFGYNAQASTDTATNQITLGNSSITTLRCQVTTITALSDFRDKTDINNVEVGLSFVEKLRPITFKWDKREWYTDGNRDGSKKDTITQTGFIAQELKALQESENATYLNLVLEDNPDKLEATPGNLMVPLIKAVQQLSAIVKQQQIEIDDLKSKVNK